MCLSFRNCGCLVFGPRGHPFVDGSEDCLRRHKVDFEKFNVAEQRRRYPRLAFPPDFEFVLDKSGGVLRADKVLQAFQVQ